MIFRTSGLVGDMVVRTVPWRVGIGGDLPDMKTAARCQVELGWSARETQHLEHMVFYRFQPFFWSNSKLTVHTAIQYDSVTKDHNLLG